MLDLMVPFAVNNVPCMGNNRTFFSLKKSTNFKQKNRFEETMSHCHGFAVSLDGE
jgi:hypothetical protein